MPYEPIYNETWGNCFTHPSYDTQPSIFNVTQQWISQYVQDLAHSGFSTCMCESMQPCTYPVQLFVAAFAIDANVRLGRALALLHAA